MKLQRQLSMAGMEEVDERYCDRILVFKQRDEGRTHIRWPIFSRKSLFENPNLSPTFGRKTY